MRALLKKQQQKLLIYLVNNKKNIERKTMKIIAYTVLILQCALFVVVGKVFFDLNYIKIALNIYLIYYLTEYVFTITHYNIVKCTLFTMLVIVLGFLFVDFPALQIIIIIYVITTFNGATIKSNKEKDDAHFFFSSKKTRIKNLINEYISYELDNNNELFALLEDWKEFDYKTLAILYYKEEKDVVEIASILNYDEKTIRKYIEKLQFAFIHKVVYN